MLARKAVWQANGNVITLSSGMGDSGPSASTKIKKPKMGLKRQSTIRCVLWPFDNPGLC